MSITTERTLRDAAPAEREQVITLTLAAYQQYEAVLPPGAWPQYAAGIQATLANPASGRVIVAVEPEALVGSVLLVPPLLEPGPGRVPQPYPEIRLVAVAPSARRRGVATALVEACSARARDEGFDHIGLHSTAYMADAIRLYRRMGFEPAPEHDFHTPAGALVMGFRLTLAG